MPQEATHEYLRCLWLGDGAPDSLGRFAAEGVARTYLTSGRFDEALHWPRSGYITNWTPCARFPIELMSVRASLRLGRPAFAAQQLRDIAPTPDCRTDRDTYFYLRGIASANELRWSDALVDFANIPDSSALLTELQRAKALAEQGARLRSKSPSLAAWLGVVPGAGYWYAGFPKSAFSALIVNAIFVQSTREAFHRDQNTLGGFLAVFSASWYAGSVYGSHASTQKYNAYHQQQILQQFEY